MKQILITPDDLIKFMGKENYDKLIDYLLEKKKHKYR